MKFPRTFRFFPRFWLPVTLLSALGFFLSGCGKPAVVLVTHATPIERQLRYQLPDGWHERYDGDGIRWGSFIGPNNAAVTITRFPGSVGNDLANINRWRAQLGLALVSEGKLNVLGDSPLKWRYVYISNDKNLIAGAIAEVEGTSLVFKLTSDKGTVDETKSTKRDFDKILMECRWE